jgi:hypothetical protein
MQQQDSIENRQFPEDLQGFEFSNYSNSDVHAPFEFSVFERIEENLDNSRANSIESKKNDKKSITSSKMFTGPKEVILVSGWIDINSVFQNYQETFYIRMIIGLTLLFCIKRYNQNYMPLALMGTLISLIYVLRNIYRLIVGWKSHSRIKFINWVEFQLSAGYFLMMLGCLLLLSNYINIIYLPIFMFPYLIISFIIFMFRSDDNAYLAQKNHCLIESLQFFMLTLKFLDPETMNWNMTMLFLTSSGIYMTTAGLLLMVILSCTLFGFMYQSLERWKIKALTWMTLYYLFSGITFIYIVKGITDYYHDGDVILQARIHSYLDFSSNETEILETAGMMLIIFNFIFFCMFLFWKKEIKKYLSRIIFKKDIRKEVSLRMFRENFTFKVIQFSAVFFKRNTQEESDKKPKEETPKVKLTDEDCIVCYSAMPNIMQEPCGHGGMCKECCLEYIKTEQKCMVCRKRIESILLIEQDPQDLSFYAKGQVKLKI